jgi:hypothetical protein
VADTEGAGKDGGSPASSGCGWPNVQPPTAKDRAKAATVARYGGRASTRPG